MSSFAVLGAGKLRLALTGLLDRAYQPPLTCKWADHSASMISAALRSPGFNFINSERAFLMSRSEPLFAAVCRATVVG